MDIDWVHRGLGCVGWVGIGIGMHSTPQYIARLFAYKNTYLNALLRVLYLRLPRK